MKWYKSKRKRSYYKLLGIPAIFQKISNFSRFYGFSGKNRITFKAYLNLVESSKRILYCKRWNFNHLTLTNLTTCISLIQVKNLLYYRLRNIRHQSHSRYQVLSHKRDLGTFSPYFDDDFIGITCVFVFSVI